MDATRIPVVRLADFGGLWCPRNLLIITQPDRDWTRLYTIVILNVKMSPFHAGQGSLVLHRSMHPKSQIMQHENRLPHIGCSINFLPHPHPPLPHSHPDISLPIHLHRLESCRRVSHGTSTFPSAHHAAKPAKPDKQLSVGSSLT